MDIDINTDMNPLKVVIFNEIRKFHKGETLSLSDQELNSLVFKRRDSLRLTLSGFIQCKAIFTAYSFELPKMMKSKLRIGLSNLTYPYFLTSNRLILFSESDALMIKLHGGIESFLESQMSS